MRKRFKIKNLIRNNSYTFFSKGEGGHSPLLYTGYPPKSNGTHYTFLSKGEERNLLPNIVRLEISGGGWTSPLLHSWEPLKKYGARLMCASNEPTPSRISKFAGSLRNSALPLGEGNHSPHLNNRTKNVTKSQSLNHKITQKCNR